MSRLTRLDHDLEVLIARYGTNVVVNALNQKVFNPESELDAGKSPSNEVKKKLYPTIPKSIAKKNPEKAVLLGKIRVLIRERRLFPYFGDFEAYLRKNGQSSSNCRTFSEMKSEVIKYLAMEDLITLQKMVDEAPAEHSDLALISRAILRR